MATEKPLPGTIGWFDLTVDDADKVRDFYSKVVGWAPSPLSMGEYNDYVMNLPNSETGVAGICHKRGANSNFPQHWLLYINVENIDESIKTCLKLGGEIVVEVKTMAEYGKYCIIRDVAGAVCGLFEHK